MQQIGQLLSTAAGAPQGPRKPRPAHEVWPPREPRQYRVQLIVEIHAEIEVTASSPQEAERLAEEHATEAKRRYKTAVYAYRSALKAMVDPRDPSKGHKWVRIESDRNETGELIWVRGKDDHP